MNSKKTMKAFGFIVIAGFFARILGFVRELIVASYYGTSNAMDAFNIAYDIPGILMAGLAASITTTFIPAFTDKLKRSGMSGAFELSRKIVTAFVLLGIIICAVGIMFAEPITHLLAPKFSPAKMALAISLTRILMLSGVFTILIGLFTGLLQSQENFNIPALLLFPFSFVIIITVILWARPWGIYALAFGTVFAIIAQVLFMVPNIAKSGFNFCPLIDFHDPDLVKVARLVTPVFLGTTILQVNTIVNRIFASGLPAGSISALNYADKIITLVVSLIASAVATVALPTLSKAAVFGDLLRLRAVMLNAVRTINVVVIPMTVGIVVLRVPLVRLLFQRGAFDENATSMTSWALLFLSWGLFAYGLRDIFSKTFYALQDTMTPMINSVITISFNIMLIFILVPRYGLAGLAFATSASGIFGGLQLLWRLKRKIGSVHGLKIMVSFLKILLASLLMGAFVSWIYPLIDGSISNTGFVQQLMVIVSVAFIGILVYTACLIGLRADEVEIVKKLIMHRDHTPNP